MATNNKDSIILNDGLNAANGFGAFGSHFAIRYFLPVYDPRIDEDIHTGTQNSTTQSATDVIYLSASFSATDIFDNLDGEKIYNQSSVALQSACGVSTAANVYSLSDDSDFVVLSASDSVYGGLNHEGIPTVSASTYVLSASQDVGLQANRLGNQYTISKMVSASDLSSAGNGNFFGNIDNDVSAVSLPNFELFGGDNTSAVGLLYEVEAFVPVDVSGSDPAVDSGRYTLRLEASKGDFKFNKVILFISKMNADGTEDTSVLPKPFSIIAFNRPHIKYKNTDTGNRLLWEAIVDLVFQRTSTQNNLTKQLVQNWSHSTSAYGLNTSNSVAIFDPDVVGSHEPDAKLHVTSKSTSADQLRLAYDLTKYTDISTTSSDVLQIKNKTYIQSTGIPITAATNADDLVVQNNYNSALPAGFSIFAGTNATSNIYFGDEDNVSQGRIVYNHSDDTFSIYTSSTRAFHIDDNGNAIIGTSTSANGQLRIIGPGGAVKSADSVSNEFVIENKGVCGMSILASSASNANIYFGDNGRDDLGRIIYNYANNAFYFYTNATASFAITSAGAGVGTLSPNGSLHVLGSLGSVTSPKAGAKDLVIENAGSCGISILSDASSNGLICFGDGSDNDVGRFFYNHPNNAFYFYTNATGRFSLTPTKAGLGTLTPYAYFHVLQDGTDSDASNTVEAANALVVQNTSSTTASAGITLYSGYTGKSSLFYGITTNEQVAQLSYDNELNYWYYLIDGTNYFNVTSAGVGIGNVTNPTGQLEIKESGSTITISPDSNADNLVIRAQSLGGISILSDQGYLAFGNDSVALDGYIKYTQGITDDITIGVEARNCLKIYNSTSSGKGNGVFQVLKNDSSIVSEIDNNGSVLSRSIVSGTQMIVRDSADGALPITTDSDYDDFVVAYDDRNVGLTIGCDISHNAGIWLGTTNNATLLSYDPSLNYFKIGVNDANTNFTINYDGVVGIDSGLYISNFTGTDNQQEEEMLALKSPGTGTTSDNSTPVTVYTLLTGSNECDAVAFIISGIKDDGSKGYAGMVYVMARNDSGSVTAQIIQNAANQYSGEISPTISVNVNVTDVELQITGDAVETVHWTAAPMYINAEATS